MEPVQEAFGRVLEVISRSALEGMKRDVVEPERLSVAWDTS